MAPLLLSACAALPNWLRDISVLGTHVSIANFLNTYGYLAVFLFIGIENLGVPFPGETMLVAASVYAAQGCGLQEPYVIAACILGSVIGSTAGYWVGRTGGRALLRRLHVSDRHLAPAEAYFVRYGGATVFFGRFLAVLRAWAAFLAGVNHMHTGRFLTYNTAGAVIWSVVFGLLGFVLGKHLDQLQRVLTALGTGGAVVVAIVVVVAIGIFWYRRRRTHIPMYQDPAPAPDAPSPSAAASEHQPERSAGERDLDVSSRQPDAEVRAASAAGSPPATADGAR